MNYRIPGDDFFLDVNKVEGQPVFVCVHFGGEGALCHLCGVAHRLASFGCRCRKQPKPQARASEGRCETNLTNVFWGFAMGVGVTRCYDTRLILILVEFTSKRKVRYRRSCACWFLVRHISEINDRVFPPRCWDSLPVATAAAHKALGQVLSRLVLLCWGGVIFIHFWRTGLGYSRGLHSTSFVQDDKFCYLGWLWWFSHSGNLAKEQVRKCAGKMWLQAFQPRTANLLCQEEFYLLSLPLLFWCGDYRFARHMTYVVCWGLLWGNLLKDVFRLPRPKNVKAEVWVPHSASQIDSTACRDFGFPSTHAMKLGHWDDLILKFLHQVEQNWK